MKLSLEWKETSPGTFERQIDTVEQFYLAANSVKSPVVNKADWYLNAGIKLQCTRPSFAADIKNAWIQTRYNFPSIAATAIEERWIYRTANRLELDSWLKETFHVHREPLTARELMSEERIKPAPRLVLHVLPGTQELLIQGPHSHLDGFGLTLIFQNLISCLVKSPVTSQVREAAVMFGDEGRNLTPPMSLCCRTPPYSAEEKQKWDQLIEDYINPRHKLYLTASNISDPPRVTRTQWMEFDAASTKEMQQQVRDRGVSLAALIQGAISLTAREHGANDGVDRHAIQALYSARQYIDPSVAEGERIMAPLLLGVPLTFALHDDFQDLISDVHQKIQSAKVDRFGLKCSPLWGTDLPKAFKAPLPHGKSIMADTQMSFIGNIDTYLSPWSEDETVEGSLTECIDYWPAVDMLSANVVNSVYIFRGQLRIALAYNEAYHSEDSMSKYLKSVWRFVDSGLGIQTVATVRKPGFETWLPEPVEI